MSPPTRVSRLLGFKSRLLDWSYNFYQNSIAVLVTARRALALPGGSFRNASAPLSAVERKKRTQKVLQSLRIASTQVPSPEQIRHL